MKLPKPSKNSSAVALLISSFVFIGACSGTDMKGNSEIAAKAKENKVINPIENGAKTKESKTTDAIKGSDNADSEKTSTETKPVIKDETKPVIKDETKSIAENTTCLTSDLTSFTSDQKQDVEVHLIAFHTSQDRSLGVRIIVKKRIKPVILVITSIDYPHINIEAEEGVKILKVFKSVKQGSDTYPFISGFSSEKLITFEANEIIYAHGGYKSAYFKYPGTLNAKLINFAETIAQYKLTSYQGCDRSSKFIIN